MATKENTGKQNLPVPAQPLPNGTNALAVYEAAISRFQEQNYNILTPITRIDHLPDIYRISVREVRIDSTDGAGDAYKGQGCKDNELALTKVALDKIAAAAGINWTETRRLDDGQDPHYCHMSVTGWLRDFDGTVRQIGATKELNFRDASDEVKSIYTSVEKSKYARDPENQIREMRRHIAQLCESKAKNRAIRSALAIKQKYTKAELQKPFIVPKLVPCENDPEVRRAMIAQATGAANMLYPPRGQVIEQQDYEVVDDDNGAYDAETGEVCEPQNGAAAAPVTPPKAPRAPLSDAERKQNAPALEKLARTASEAGFFGSKEELLAYCAKRLGFPLMRINDMTPDEFKACLGARENEVIDGKGKIDTVDVPF